MYLIWKDRLLYHLQHKRARIVYSLLLALYLCRLFGDSPSLATQSYYVQLRVQEIKLKLSTIPRPQMPVITFRRNEPEDTSSGSARIWLPFSVGVGGGKPLPHAAIPTNGPGHTSDTSNPGDNTSSPPNVTLLPSQTTPSTALQPTQRPPVTQPTSRPPAIPTSRAPTAAPTQPQLPSPINCPTFSLEGYDSIPIQSAPTMNASSHGDINLALRGYGQISGTLDLIDVGGDIDNTLPPQLDAVLSDRRRPQFYAIYKVNEWNFGSNTRGGPIANPQATLTGLRVDPGEEVVVPESGYDIGNGKEVMVLYAESTRVTLKYTRDDNVIMGYTIHIEDFCVDPNLLRKYNDLHAAGRNSLPALPAGKKLGVARTHELKVSIRDTGAFMDPRVRKDWWQRY